MIRFFSSLKILAVLFLLTPINLLANGIPSYEVFCDILTMKMDPDGTEEWRSLYTNGEHNAPGAILLRPSGNVTIAGQDGSGLVAMQYDAAGSLTWKSFSTINAIGTALVPDQSGGVVVGASRGDRIITTSFDENGGPNWRNIETYSGSIGAPPVSMDHDDAGNVYLAALVGDPFTLTVLKYDSAGTMIWERQTDVQYPWNQSTKVVVSPSGQVTVGTNMRNNETGIPGQFVLLHYDADGELLWQNSVPSLHPCPSGTGYTVLSGFNDLDVDQDGNVAVTGTTGCQEEGATGDSTTVTLLYDSQGNLLWENRVEDKPSQDQDARKISFDGEGNILVATRKVQYFKTGFYDWQIFKYDPNGTLLWTIDHDSLKAGRWLKDMHVSQNGDVTLLGLTDCLELEGSGDYLCGYVIAKYSNNGSQLWSINPDGSGFYSQERSGYEGFYMFHLAGNESGSLAMAGTSCRVVETGDDYSSDSDDDDEENGCGI